MTYYKLEENKRRDLLQSITLDLMKNEDMLFAYLFGSFKDYDEKVGFRDIDIAVYFSPEEDPLSKSLSIGADLSSKYHLPIDCVPINEASLYFRYRIFREGIELFCKDESQRDEIIEKTVTEALDYMPLRAEAIRELV